MTGYFLAPVGVLLAALFGCTSVEEYVQAAEDQTSALFGGPSRLRLESNKPGTAFCIDGRPIIAGDPGVRVQAGDRVYVVDPAPDHETTIVAAHPGYFVSIDTATPQRVRLQFDFFERNRCAISSAGRTCVTLELTSDLEAFQRFCASTGAGSADLSSDWPVVRVFYGTDRDDRGGSGPPKFGAARGAKLSLGTVAVSIPIAQHRIGQIERPWSMSLLGFTLSRDEDPGEHFVVQRTVRLDRQGFLKTIRRVIQSSERFRKQAFVFIHGYNVGFQQAAFRTAQIAYDLQFDGAPILYSWPSRSSMYDYEYDQNSVRQSRPFLSRFLEMIKAESGAEIVHLIAHSMGNDLLMEVLVGLNSPREEQSPAFNQIILAAPDIDVDVFYQLAEKITGVARGITLYASAKDRALDAARFYARGVHRAGDVPPDGPVILAGIDTIDISALETSPLSLNHSQYVEDEFLLNDIGLLLKSGLRPPDARSPILRRLDKGNGTYWELPQ